MDTNEIKKQIKLALDLVKDLDEPYKLETYKIILMKSPDFILSSVDSVKVKNDEKPKLVTNSNPNMNTLADLCNVDVRELSDVLKIDNNEVTLKKILRGTEAEQQTLGSQLILLGYEFGLGILEVDSRTLKEALKKSRVPDKSRNFAHNLKIRQDLFSMSSNGQRKNLYALTANKGRTSAIELLAKYAKGEDNN